MSDIYFEPNYGKLYEKMENGVCEVFEYKSELGSVSHIFIKREIPTRIDDTAWYDLATPYGYGGPLVVQHEEGKKELLVKEFEKEFHKYCTANNIVSEFIRFHPIVSNADDFKSVYEVSHDRNTVGTNLAAYDNPFQSEFGKSCRKDIRRILKNGVSFKVHEQPSDLSKFKEIYYSTMNRNQAADYYYFGDEYFEQCVAKFGKNLLLVEAIYKQQPIAMGLYFVYNKTIHIHLSGTLSEFIHLSPAYILKYAITQWGKEKGYHLIHHGGGRSNNPEDPLFSYKKKFGKSTEFKFYVGKKVWNEQIYNELSDVVEGEKKSSFFPLYRCK